jgi:hypothetical protein
MRRFPPSSWLAHFSISFAQLLRPLHVRIRWAKNFPFAKITNLQGGSFPLEFAQSWGKGAALQKWQR